MKCWPRMVWWRRELRAAFNAGHPPRAESDLSAGGDDHLPPPAEIARQIIEDPEEALGKFQLIEADLNPGTNRGD
jgi:hypothetical protein